MKTYRFEQLESFMVPVLDSGAARVVHFSFPGGKKLERHKTPSDVLIFVLRGKVQYEENNQTVMLSAGEMVSTHKNVEHSIEAVEDSVVALVLTPSPSAVQKKSVSAQQVPFSPPSPAEGTISPQLMSFVEEHADLLKILDRADQAKNPDIYTQADKIIGEELNQHFSL